MQLSGIVDRAKLWHDISSISVNAYGFFNSQYNHFVSNALLDLNAFYAISRTLLNIYVL